MGITGLLPLLEKGKVSRPSSIKEFKGCTVAADAYCWLHKGAFSCADKLARGEETDMYVQYCMKYVNMLLANDIKPILVFDGRHLPAKAQTEKKRRERREENRKQAASLLRQGHTTEALSFLRRCIDVTHKMALTLMQECRRRNVDCIVAPYEADAQLAFFSLEGVADLIVTEDSDLLLFGCKKVMFKLDLNGHGILVDQSQLYLSMGVRPETYTFEKFRYMCILSGCDYLDSLPGIGLGKACKFISRTQDPDIHKALSRLPSQLNIRGLAVTMDYRDEFMKADAMFRHQLVFDPRIRKTKPLTPHQSVHPGSVLAAGPLPGCVPEFDDYTCYQLALGNLDPFKLEKVDNFDPSAPRSEKEGVRTKGWNQTAVAPHPSIWDPQFMEKIAKQKPKPAPSFMPCDSRPVTKGKIKAMDTNLLAKSESRKRTCDFGGDLEEVKKPSLDSSDSKLTALYTSPRNTVTAREDSLTPEWESPKSEAENLLTSPILSGKRTSKNPFARSMKFEDAVENIDKEVPHASPVTTPSSKQPSKFGALNKFARAIQRTSTEGKPIVQSRYFGNVGSNEAETAQQDTDIPPQNLLRDVSNTVEEYNEDELLMMQSYRKSSGVDVKSPKVHKKPLFASSNTSKDTHGDMENECVADPSLLSEENMLSSTFYEKFKKQESGPKLRPSPTKNPFKKVALAENDSGNSEIVDEMNNSFGIRHGYTDADEDVDDPGFESSTSLTPCSPSIALSDDGFESPSKICAVVKTSPSVFQKKSQSSQNLRKPACRISGLKKPSPSVSGQSKLSAFGFTPKPKIQRS